MKSSLPTIAGMTLAKLSLAVGAGLIITACGGGSDSSSNDDLLTLDNVRQVLNTNADIALAAYTDSVITAEALLDAIEALEADPTQATLDAARKAWLVAREPYGQTEVYRFRNSPIDSTDYSSEDGPEGDINAWPLGEALIDYVVVNDDDNDDMEPEGDFGTDQVGVTDNGLEVGDVTDAGAYEITIDEYNNRENIIGRTDIEINAALLANNATADDEHDVIAGYHAIEFLLWGQDLNDNGETTEGDDRDEAVKTYGVSALASGGQRPVSDFTEETYGERRLTYLKVATQKLIDDLTAVRDGWAVGASYRNAFTTINSEADAQEKLTEILTGMGTLSEGELGGERMQIALSANSQEDEHSCFSDNTHRDVWLNAEGVSNSYYGVYAGYDSDLDGVDDVSTNAVDGYGLDDLLADAGKNTLKAEFEAALTLTETNYKAIDTQARAGSPFDVQIMTENLSEDSPIAKTILALNAQSRIVVDFAAEIGVDGSVVVDPDASGCDTENPTASCD
ncbi:MAG: imelysin family protein [Thalassolituus sp.]